MFERTVLFYMGENVFFTERRKRRKTIAKGFGDIFTIKEGTYPGIFHFYLLPICSGLIGKLKNKLDTCLKKISLIKI